MNAPVETNLHRGFSSAYWLTAEENEEINSFLSKFANCGQSVRGTRQNVVEKMENLR